MKNTSADLALAKRLAEAPRIAQTHDCSLYLVTLYALLFRQQREDSVEALRAFVELSDWALMRAQLEGKSPHARMAIIESVIGAADLPPSGLVQIQVTLEVQGNEADAIRAVSSSLESGAWQNSLLEHDVEGLPPLSLHNVIVGARDRVESAFRVVDKLDVQAQPSVYGLENVHVIGQGSLMHVTKHGRASLGEMADWTAAELKLFAETGERPKAESP
jgi:hypothetical protein